MGNQYPHISHSDVLNHRTDFEAIFKTDDDLKAIEKLFSDKTRS